jgi:hypothetical protein
VNEAGVAAVKEVKSEEEAVGAEVAVLMEEETGVKEENGEVGVKTEEEEAEEVAEAGENTAMEDVNEKKQKPRLKKKTRQVRSNLIA